MAEILSFTGAHGTGKTTAAYRLAETCKIANPGKSVHVLCDQEALCPFPINKQTTQQAQMWIFTNQISQELFLSTKFNIIITDRTIVDAIAYTYVAGFEQLGWKMLQIAKMHMPIYTLIKFRHIIDNEFCHQDGIRETTDSKFRQEIEDELVTLYEQLMRTENLNSLLN